MGRQAVVSGGGTGIGAAVARALAEDGFQVVIVGRRASVLEATARELGDAVRPVVADLTSVPDVERLASTVDGQVDVLVNNAGGFDLDREDGLAGTADWWRRVYESNVISAVLLTEALRDRLAHPAGRAILLSSVAAQRGRAGPYSAAKAALHGWAYDLARELGAHGATVNVIAPGYIAETEFFGGRLTPEGPPPRVAGRPGGGPGRPASTPGPGRHLDCPHSGHRTGQEL